MGEGEGKRHLQNSTVDGTKRRQGERTWGRIRIIESQMHGKGEGKVVPTSNLWEKAKSL